MAIISSYQVKKEPLWQNALFYLAVGLLIITTFCYIIFSFKVFIQSQRMGDIDSSIANYGTAEQKTYEKKVLDYKKNIDDFAVLLNNHKISSNIFIFIEQNTLPAVWFSKFDFSGAGNGVKLSGESENMDTLSRQINAFEKSKEVKDISLANSEVTFAGKVQFSIDLILDPKIFNYTNNPLVLY